jgi:GTP cyclohydrolase I
MNQTPPHANRETYVSAHALIPDTQSERDDRAIAIQRVGVCDLRYPLQLQLGAEIQPTVATWSLDVALPAEKKGTHMSRFIAWLDDLHQQRVPQDVASLRIGLQGMLRRLDATQGRVEAVFPLFIRKQAPVSGISSLLDYQGALIAEQGADSAIHVWMQAVVPVKSLCPCSKEISDYGAHNQRSHVTIRVEPHAEASLSWQELVRFAEESASSEIWGLLKRADEKWVTERAYENPRFVEDLVREVALRLNADARVGAYSVTVENFESIHNHSAFAVIERASTETTKAS